MVLADSHLNVAVNLWRCAKAVGKLQLVVVVFVAAVAAAVEIERVLSKDVD